MIKSFEQLFCEHRYELNRWHICHGLNGNNPAEIEAEYICDQCGKIMYQHLTIDFKEDFEKICPQYERRKQQC